MNSIIKSSYFNRTVFCLFDSREQNRNKYCETHAACVRFTNANVKHTLQPNSWGKHNKVNEIKGLHATTSGVVRSGD